MKLKITKEQQTKAQGAAVRQAEIDLGMRRPVHAIFKNKKAYSRKSKFQTVDC